MQSVVLFENTMGRPPWMIVLYRGLLIVYQMFLGVLVEEGMVFGDSMRPK